MQNQAGLRSLSIVVPAYNEERRLPATLDKLAGFLYNRRYPFSEILVVDDGSSDRTAAVVEQRIGLEPNLQLLRNPGNRGKGYAVRHGMQVARGEWVLFTDADLSTPIEEIDRLCEAVQQGSTDGAIGSRALDRSLIGVRQPLLRELSGRTFNLVMRAITGLGYADTQCGFKLFSAEACRLISRFQRLERFGFDVEILYIAKKHGLRVAEVPVKWNDVEGTKVTVFAGLSAFADVLQVRWNDWKGAYRN